MMLKNLFYWLPDCLFRLSRIQDLYLWKTIVISLNRKTMKTTLNLNGSLAIAGGLLAGLGTGFFFLQTNALYFVGSLMAGLGIGLIIGALIGREKLVEEKK